MTECQLTFAWHGRLIAFASGERNRHGVARQWQYKATPINWLGAMFRQFSFLFHQCQHASSSKYYNTYSLRLRGQALHVYHIIKLQVSHLLQRGLAGLQVTHTV